MSVPLIRNVKIHRILARVLPTARYVWTSICEYFPCFILAYNVYSTIAFYAALIAIPNISQFTEKADVREHAYLYGFIPDQVTYDGINFMIDTISSLSKSCYMPPRKEIEYSNGLEGFSHWYEDLPEDAPEIYKAIDRSVKEEAPLLEVGYNDFRYVFRKGLGVTGTSLLLRMKCARCSSRGTTLMVVTLDTGSKRLYSVEESGKIRKLKDAGSSNNRCSTSLMGVGIAIAAMREITKCDNQVQDIILLITDRNLPYAAGTRQFLDDYFNKPNFKWHSGWLHHAMALELGYGRCGLYELNYEGMDGLIPNHDVVTSFLMEANNQALEVSPMGLWERVGSMALNGKLHLPHVPMLARNIQSFSITCARKANVTEPNNTENLFKTIVVTLKMQNNLESALERADNAYEMASNEAFVPQAFYMVLVPMMLLSPLIQLFYSSYTWDFHVLLASLALFLLNAFMGPWLSYKYLVDAISREFHGSAESNLLHVKKAIVLLLLSGVVLLALNIILARAIPADVFAVYVEGKKVCVREELRSELGYPIEQGTLKCKIHGWLNMLMDRLRRKSDSIQRFFHRCEDGDARQCKRKRLSLRLSTFMQRMGIRHIEAPSLHDCCMDEPPTEAEKHATEVCSKPQEVECKIDEALRAEKEDTLERMGNVEVLYPTNTGMPLPHIIVSIGTLFFAVVFLYATLLFNWPLSIILTLILVPSLRSVQIWNNTHCKRSLDTLVCLTYVVFILLLSRRPNILKEIRKQFFRKMFTNGKFDPLVFVAGPFHNFFIFMKNFPIDEVRAAFKEPFVLQKLYDLAQQHVLLGSATFPMIWFCAFPVIFHTVLVYTLARFYKPAEKTD